MKVTTKQYLKAQKRFAECDAIINRYLAENDPDDIPVRRGRKAIPSGPSVEEKIEEITTHINTLSEILQTWATALYNSAIPDIPGRTEFDEDLISALDSISRQLHDLNELE